MGWRIDGLAKRQARNQGEAGAYAEKEDSGHQADMKPRYGEQVGDPGIPNRTHEGRRDGASHSRHQRRGDGSFGTVEAGGHALRHRLPQPGEF